MKYFTRVTILHLGRNHFLRPLHEREMWEVYEEMSSTRVEVIYILTTRRPLEKSFSHDISICCSIRQNKNKLTIWSSWKNCGRKSKQQHKYMLGLSSWEVNTKWMLEMIAFSSPNIQSAHPQPITTPKMSRTNGSFIYLDFLSAMSYGNKYKRQFIFWCFCFIYNCQSYFFFLGERLIRKTFSKDSKYFLLHKI